MGLIFLEPQIENVPDERDVVASNHSTLLDSVLVKHDNRERTDISSVREITILRKIEVYQREVFLYALDAIPDDCAMQTICLPEHNHGTGLI